MRKHRHFKTVVCLALGVVILTGAAFANFDNANGYTMYKNAVKNMIYAENFSANVNMSLTLDGETQIAGSKVEYMFDKNGYTSEYEKNYNYENGSETYTTERWIQDGQRINKYGSGNYSVSKTFNDKGWLTSQTSDPDQVDFMNKTIRFIELAADTFVGDLKNNFVLSGTENGQKSYQVNLRNQQIPEIVNAGLSMAFSSINASSNYEPSYVALDESYYEAMNNLERSRKYGGGDSEITEAEIRAFYESDEYLAAQRKINEMHDKGYEELKKRGNKGIVFVGADGSMTYYATQDEYYAARDIDINSSGISDREMLEMLGTEPFIDGANCYITFDEYGRILTNNIDGTLSGYDKDGVKHSFTLKVEISLYDYGTTKINPVDVDSLPVNPEPKPFAYSIPTQAIPSDTQTIIVTGDSKVVTEAA